MWEKLLVVAIVLAAVVYTVRRMIRSGKTSSCGCGCSSCGASPSRKDKCGSRDG
ncbi:FeoB-associated Cys-rich membrane protein [Desulfolutivibrio sulfoxidireducens]|uniref:FeoB-associated Cys-rich membrane protein n=1 Tax=Desulfolutivibrio sulfoxidireducens TaxID=2773299 RepID=UPI00159D8ACD|nr:FeoB-associated Cys-rich membrane protein [Desulfolutivibrio sulfoxidireducens]QLA17531.1 FeoB-associated Cys-rich membrane protein [Desulfolutivibrio sulfoxidireducens]QLA21117.1 FeoB-associated Cys-rich membrane protein [Desulfolutivibrio sulfoxidireducens]